MARCGQIREIIGFHIYLSHLTSSGVRPLSKVVPMRGQEIPQVTLGRRAILQTSGAALLAASTAGCGLFSTAPSKKDGAHQGTAVDVGAKESPVLTREVQAGRLPALEARLPKAPLVVQPTDRLGTYGGTWRSALLGPADTPWLTRTVGYENLLRWDVNWTKVIPNIAESFEVAADGREYVFKLRQGMRWSDGHSFTAEDVLFACNHVLLNQELTPATPDWLSTPKGPAKVVREGDNGVRFIFPQPNGLFLYRMAFPYGDTLLPFQPRHYLEQFHKGFNTKADSLAKHKGLPDWVALFQAQLDRWSNPELPTVYAWRVVNPVGKGSRVTCERNAYYWKTDPAGRQLPYLDGVAYEVTSDENVILLKAANGEIDMHTRTINSATNKPVLARERAKGKYHFVDLKPSYPNQMVIQLNLTHQDPVLRRIFSDKRFRIALSHAINRPEMINAVFQRQGRPWQAAPRPESPFYDEEFAQQYLEFDLAKANQILDQAGYTPRDRSGIRLRPDGKQISFSVEVATPTLVPYWTDAMELVCSYWRNVGIKATVKPEDRSLFTERIGANRHDAAVWQGLAGRYFDIMLQPTEYVPVGGSRYAVPWKTWGETRGASGEVPPPPVRRQFELYEQIKATVDKSTQDKLMREILQIAKDEFYVIGTVLEEQGYGIVSDKMHNVPAAFPESNMYSTPAATNTEQYFMS
ncbi:ABC transporter substrate-binding protein [Kribbella sp. NPDC050820]|uniref:ABC transporter substrate-binding protein n=1 Tax=Kribbella sp. NPDC050820 TaxID=3155408 RepID=UPI0033CE4683